MIDRAVGAAEVATRKTELRDLDRAFGSDLARAVALDLDEFEVGEDVPVEIECGGGGAALERQEGSQSLGHGIDAEVPDPRRLDPSQRHPILFVGIDLFQARCLRREW